MRSRDSVPLLNFIAVTIIPLAAHGCEGCGSTELAGDIAADLLESEDLFLDFDDAGDDFIEPADDVLPSPETWARTYGGVGYDILRSVRPMSDGGYVATGETYSFGGGTANFWVIRLDRSGDVLWARTYGGEGDDYARDIQETQDGGFIVAGSSSSFNDSTFLGSEICWALKLDNMGLVSWQRTLNSSGEIETVYRVIQTVDGGYLLAGAEGRLATRGSLLLARLGTGGELQWVWSYNMIFSRSGAVYEVSESRYFVMGENKFIIVDGNGEILWFAVTDGEAGFPTSDGGFVVAGETDSGETMQHDVTISRFDESGEELWRKSYSMAWDEHAASIAQARDGGFVVAGYTEFSDARKAHALVLRTDRDGELVWQRVYGGPEYDRACCIMVLDDGGLVIGATTQSFGFGYDDFWLLKVSGEGTIEGSCPEDMIGDVDAATQVMPIITWDRDIDREDLGVESEETSVPSVETDVLTSSLCSP